MTVDRESIAMMILTLIEMPTDVYECSRIIVMCINNESPRVRQLFVQMYLAADELRPLQIGCKDGTHTYL